MRFLTVDSIIKEIMEAYPKAKDVYVSFIQADSKPDQFGKLTTYPMLLVIQEPNKKTVLKYDDIVNMFEDKTKRRDALLSFDNCLKTSLINNKLFRERY